MAARDESPWAEHEKVTLLSEMLKAAPIRSEVLMNLIQEHRVKPRWDEMPLPPGRSLSSCKHAFSVLLGRTGSIYDVLDPPISHGPDKKRMYHYDAVVGNTMPSNSPTTGGRPIHPRPPIHQIVEHTPGPVGYRQPATGVLDRQQQVKRKRGRPSKAETQVKAAEAAARGEIYHPQSRKPQRPVSVGMLATSPATSGLSLSAPPPISARSSDANVAYRGISSESRPGPSSTYGSAERDVSMAEPGDQPSASSSQATRDPAQKSPRESGREVVRESPREPAQSQQSEPERKDPMGSDGEQQVERSRRHLQERSQEHRPEHLNPRPDTVSYRAPQSPRD